MTQTWLDNYVSKLKYTSSMELFKKVFKDVGTAFPKQNIKIGPDGDNYIIKVTGPDIFASAVVTK